MDKRKCTIPGIETLPPGEQSVALLPEQPGFHIRTATLTRPFQHKHGPRPKLIIKPFDIFTLRANDKDSLLHKVLVNISDTSNYFHLPYSLCFSTKDTNK
jgi:hypothetical protein